MSRYGDHAVKGLAIKDVAERTGLAAGTIRMWEQRYGVPIPSRTASGYRIYSDGDVELLRRALGAARARSVRAGGAGARAGRRRPDRPALDLRRDRDGRRRRRAPQVLRKRTLMAISRAIEDETLARAAGPVVFGAFQRERHYRAVAAPLRRLAANADAAVVFADFAEPREVDGGPPRSRSIPRTRSATSGRS